MLVLEMLPLCWIFLEVTEYQPLCSWDLVRWFKVLNVSEELHPITSSKNWCRLFDSWSESSGATVFQMTVYGFHFLLGYNPANSHATPPAREIHIFSMILWLINTASPCWVLKIACIEPQVLFWPWSFCCLFLFLFNFSYENVINSSSFFFSVLLFPRVVS